MWLLTTRTAATVIRAASARQGVRSAPGFRGVRSGTLRAFSPKVAFAAGSTSPRGASSSKPKGVRRKRASPAPVEWHVYDENEAIAAEMTPSAGKRKADSDAGGSGGAKKHHGKGPLTSRKRWRHLRRGDIAEGDGRPILYVCDRDQRCADNWALLHCTDLARKHGNAPIAVACPVDASRFVSDAGSAPDARQFVFMLRGLEELEASLASLGIPLFLIRGDPNVEVAALVARLAPSVVVTDFGALREDRVWRDGLAETISVPLHEVDAHNVVPVWETSEKQEYAARTIRPKIHKKLGSFLTDFPAIEDAMPSSPEGGEGAQRKAWAALDIAVPKIDWDGMIRDAAEKGKAVPEVTWCKPGEAAALCALKGETEGKTEGSGKGGTGFLSKARLGMFDSKRNDPNVPAALSGLSPYLHFGQLSAQRCAVEAIRFKKKHSGAGKSVDNFLEELVVRRELTDNFCFYNEKYDSVEGASGWAQETLRVHSSDRRDRVYSQEAFEKGKTHDELWNAAQHEMVHFGKMHGFMRMYWAKKILEWSESPAEGLRIALYLNNKYQLDGRDPNGFVGCMWSICGIHDMGWTERPVFGKIRFMNYNGCKRKFNIEGYVQRIRRHVRDRKYYCE